MKLDRSGIKSAKQPPDYRAYRLEAIDILRGLAMVIMALDHVRDFFMFGVEPDPMGNPNIAVSLFATRWITHFCAPVFVLLAGASAGLMAARKSRGDLARFLFTRGLWLIFVEIFIIAPCVTFSPFGIPEEGGLVVVSLQVIWAIGVSMVVLSGLQLLGRDACFALGIAIVAGHNLLDSIWPPSHLLDDQRWPAWVALHSQMILQLGPFLFFFIYPVLPWVGVMSLGFGISGVLELPPPRLDGILRRVGMALTVGFLLIRATGVYGDPNPWQVQPGGSTATIIDFLNTTKHPPSLAFLMMTLGPAAILCSFAGRITRVIKDALVTFGRVPFAFYVAHVLLVHLLSVFLGVIQGFSVRQMMTIFAFYPKGYGIGLTGVYAVWALVVGLLYPFCRWVASVKARRRDWWLSYI